MNSTIKKALENSISYQEYRLLIEKLVEEKSTTGKEKTQENITFTLLNNQRMKRWDKTIKATDAVKEKIQVFNQSTTWLVITESWCGDAAHVLPVINTVATLNKNIALRIVLRDENAELMDAFLTEGARSIPKLIMIDNATGEVIQTYGPRPSTATKMVNAYKAKHGKLTPEFKEELQHWYNKNKGQDIIADLVSLLCELDATVCL
ncbi:MAG TPA: thioredoxin family protein [Flavobacteriaceae bacterium]|nr:thioredoxin family protein [Flavobacteriaceae bacterium]